mmetsp:Transcript_40480/g.112443  ORF Transcript_40480/g.112443 Transcript_40480/m.112443 type:complete len:247 (-) Transcript_40480:110-850(-)
MGWYRSKKRPVPRSASMRSRTKLRLCSSYLAMATSGAALSSNSRRTNVRKLEGPFAFGASRRCPGAAERFEADERGEAEELREEAGLAERECAFAGACAGAAAGCRVPRAWPGLRERLLLLEEREDAGDEARGGLRWRWRRSWRACFSSSMRRPRGWMNPHSGLLQRQPNQHSRTAGRPPLVRAGVLQRARLRLRPGRPGEPGSAAGEAPRRQRRRPSPLGPEPFRRSPMALYNEREPWASLRRLG